MSLASFFIGSGSMILRFLIVFSCAAALTACDNDNNNSKSTAKLTAPPSDCFWVAQVTPALEEGDNVVRSGFEYFLRNSNFRTASKCLVFYFGE